MNLFDLTAKITLDTGKFKSGVKESQSKFSEFSAWTVAKGAIIAKGIEAGAKAIFNIGKAAVAGYADYQQLAGGVDTLFKESSEKVKQYAAEAYSNAGMSANEYMETVTGFSASLLQSLGGDTEKAAEKANQALIDMSDNANKMGTDMESIKYAYGGFAKGNFTMLDNLKLGYGGTKAEMQRLLDKANELNAQQGINSNYQIDSYADIVDAIHVVQTEMGITGTTADEAATTISGSIGSMKAAWSNLTVGLAAENANIEELLTQFVASVATVAGNIIPVILRTVQNIGTTIYNNFPMLAQRGFELIGKIAAGIAKGIPDLLKKIPEMIDMIIDGFKKADVDWLQIGKDIVSGIWEGMKSLGGWLVDKAKGFFGGLFDGVKEEEEIHSPSKKWAKIGRYMAQGVGVGWDNAFPSVQSGIEAGMSFKTGSVSFARSAIGSSSAQMVNAAGAAHVAGIPGLVEIVLKTDEGVTFARRVVQLGRQEEKSNPEVVSDFS